MDLAEIRELCGSDREIITRHCQIQMELRGISIADAEYAILHGEIIEDYPDDTPFPSCLIFSRLIDYSPLHVVCSVGDGYLYLITAYRPTLDKFEPDFKTRRKEAQK